jgi:hypothetical protein
LVLKVSQAHQVQLAPLAPKEAQVLQGQLAQLGLPVLQVRLGLKVHLGLLAPQALKAHLAPQAKLVLLALKEAPDPQGLQEQQVQQVQQVPSVLKELKVHLAPQAQRDLKAPLDRQVPKVSRV